MLNTFRARSNCEQDAKFIQDRIVHVERTIAELCQVLDKYSRKAARLQERGEEMSQILRTYSKSENINKSLGGGLEGFASCVSKLGDCGDSRVNNLERKVVKELSRYEDICKAAKGEVRLLYSVREKEVAKKRQLTRIKERSPRNRQQLIQAETELVKASAEVAKTLHNLEKTSAEFEKQKLIDMKSILLDFTSVEMAYHAKALEILTDAYKSIDNINQEADLEEFKKALRFPKFEQDSHKSGLSKSTKSFGSLRSIFGSSRPEKPEGIPKGPGLSMSMDALSSPKHNQDSTSESEETASHATDNSPSDSEGSDDSSEATHIDEQSSPLPKKHTS